MLTDCMCFQSSSVVMNQRLQNSGVAGSAGPKIVAPSSALIAASRLIRDPRLRRQQQNQNSVVNSNVQLESKPQVDSPNKIVVSSKMNVRDNRTDPRSVTNKDSASAPPEKAKSVVRPFPKSRSKLHDGSARKPVRPAKTLDTESKGDSSSKSSSASSLDSPTKVRRDKKFLSPTKSPSKIKKKDADRKVSPKQSPGKGESHKPQKTDAASPPTFKDIKLSMKNRNYIRRNRKTSESPDAARDVDLRLGGPPEKQGEAAEDKSKIFIMPNVVFSFLFRLASDIVFFVVTIYLNVKLVDKADVILKAGIRTADLLCADLEQTVDKIYN